MAIEHVRKWRIGDVEVVRIVELNNHEDPFSMLMPGYTPEQAKAHAWLAPNFATPEGVMKISFQAFALRSQGKSMMIDTCIGADREREYGVFCNMQTSFLEDLEWAGYPADDMDYVLCTHLHFDHVGWNTKLVDGKWVPTFKNARYLFGEGEYGHWRELQRTGGYHDVSHLLDSIDPVVEAGLVDFVSPTHRINDEISLFPSPGHTPGHVSVRIQSGGQEAVITGDMMHHPIQLAEPTREGAFDMDKAAGLKTRKDFYERVADTDVTVIGSHFCDPTAGRIVRDGAAFRLRTED